MRIGIITILKVNNYGAELQAYALQKKLELLGHDSEIIDYLHYKHPNYVFSRQARPVFKIGIVNSLKERVYPWYERLKRLTDGQCKERIHRFESFHRQHTKISSDTYCSMDELYDSRMAYDVFMVGSDQVWNPRSNVSLAPYFLTFAPQGKKTISYASSFGVSEIPKGAESVYARWLSHIQCLSVREEQGVEIIRKLTGREAAHVLDPTLLLNADEWRRIAASPSNDAPYVLLYDLIPSRYAVDLATRAAKANGLRVVRVAASKRTGCRDVADVLNAGPAEFLGLFANAACVVTNSFHGTAFSVNFRKPFFTVVPEKMSNTSRLVSFLESVNLERRLVMEKETIPRSLGLKIDYDNAESRLHDLRSRSLAFLVDSVSN